jgi:hypothetical protein
MPIAAMLRFMTGIRLPNRIKTWINGVGLGVWASGAAWLLFHYWLYPQDGADFSVNPAVPWSLKIHGAFGFLAVWTGGLLWGLHIVKAWDRRRHRWSGGTLIGALLLLIVSGYFLYYAGDDRSRQVISKTHWILGLLLPLAYLIHRLAKTIRRPKSSAH